MPTIRITKGLVSSGWSYDFPIDIEQGGKPINDDTEDIVGSVLTESMLIQLVRNGPYGLNQH